MVNLFQGKTTLFQIPEPTHTFTIKLKLIMRKVFLLFAALFCSIILFAQSYVTTQDINFRKGAGANFETISVMPKGTTIEVLETSGSYWNKVSYDRNRVMYQVNFCRVRKVTTTAAMETAYRRTLLHLVISALG